MQQLTNEEKARLYNQYLFQYNRVQEEIRLIRAENFEPTESDLKKIKILEDKAKNIFNQTKRLY